MKRNFFIAASMICLYSCGNTSPNVSKNKDTITPQNATRSTPDNPGGLQPSGAGTTTTGTSTGGTDTTGMNRDSMHR